MIPNQWTQPTKLYNIIYVVVEKVTDVAFSFGYPKLIGVLQLFFGALVGVSTPNQAEKNAYFSEVFKWGHLIGAFVRVWKIIRIDEPGFLK